MQTRSRFTFWFYLALIGILVVALVYYQGLTSDVNAVAPYLIQLGSLSQGRNPYTGQFSNYPTQAKSAGPGHGHGSRSNTSLIGGPHFMDRFNLLRRRVA